MPAKFINPNQQICSYGQARVFNSTSFDLFTQDWRVKLVKANILNEDLLAQFLLGKHCAPDNPGQRTVLGLAARLGFGTH
jgi:hypothetical protein